MRLSTATYTIFASEYMPNLAHRQNWLWFLYAVKQYGPDGFLDGLIHIPWYLIRTSPGSRDFIDLRVYILWLAAAIVTAVLLVIVRSVRTAKRITGPVSVVLSAPLIASVLGGGGAKVTLNPDFAAAGLQRLAAARASPPEP